MATNQSEPIFHRVITLLIHMACGPRTAMIAVTAVGPIQPDFEERAVMRQEFLELVPVIGEVLRLWGAAGCHWLCQCPERIGGTVCRHSSTGRASGTRRPASPPCPNRARSCSCSPELWPASSYGGGGADERTKISGCAQNTSTPIPTLFCTLRRLACRGRWRKIGFPSF